MVDVAPMRLDDVDEVVERVRRAQQRVSERHPLINGAVDTASLYDSFATNLTNSLVARREGRIVGHLHAVVLESDLFGHSVWINPDGLSYDDAAILESLYVAGADHWLSLGADRHYVWVPRDASVSAWLDLGFAYMHQRGTRSLESLTVTAPPTGCGLRRGTISDLEVALALDDHLHEAQEAGPSYALNLSTTSQRDEWIETLEDPETLHIIMEFEGQPIAQCASFPVPERTGSFPRSIHLSAVTVREEYRRLGVARSMVDHLLDLARLNGYAYAETNWRVTNRRAARYWETYGFTPTYLRLHRHVGVG